MFKQDARDSQIYTVHFSPINLSLNIPCRDLGHLLVLEELPLCRVLDMYGALKPAER